MSRYRLYIAGVVLVVVAVISYYFMNMSPGTTTKTERKRPLTTTLYSQKQKTWKKDKFFSNNHLGSVKTPGRTGLIEHPSIRRPVEDNFRTYRTTPKARFDSVPVVPFNDVKLIPSRFPDTKQAVGGQEIWRIVNESRFYGPSSKYSDYFHAMKRLVHLDLKGAPPNKQYLQTLFPLFKRFGATGIILEYEDMFPYKDKLAVVAAKNCYTQGDIKEIIEYATQSELEVIPLVQTFGHLEYLLKHEEFRPLRDLDDSPLVITPALESSYAILTEMITQVVKLHPASKYVHIGCDEVFELGTGLSASLIQKGKTKDDIIIDHIKRISTIVKNFQKQSIMWDDMLRPMDSATLQKSGLGQVVEPMVWSYIPNPSEKLPRNVWSKYTGVFKRLWVASSFKGATGSGRVMTDATYHLKNHLNWIRLIEAIGPGARDQNQAVNIVGIGITGWQRYEHFGTLCELLPAGIPSLAVSLKVMQLGGFDKETHQLVSKQLQCEKPVKLDLCEKYADDDGCRFPGSTIYYKLRLLWGKLQKYAKIKEDVNSFASEVNYKHQFFNPYRLKRINSSLVNLNASIGSIEQFMMAEIPQYFDPMTAKEWVAINIRMVTDEITDEVLELNKFAKKKSWSLRPGYESGTLRERTSNTSSTFKIVENSAIRNGTKQRYIPKMSGFKQLNKIRRKFNQSKQFQRNEEQQSPGRSNGDIRAGSREGAPGKDFQSENQKQTVGRSKGMSRQYGDNGVLRQEIPQTNVRNRNDINKFDSSQTITQTLDIQRQKFGEQQKKRENLTSSPYRINSRGQSTTGVRSGTKSIGNNVPQEVSRGMGGNQGNQGQPQRGINVLKDGLKKIRDDDNEGQQSNVNKNPMRNLPGNRGQSKSEKPEIPASSFQEKKYSFENKSPREKMGKYQQ